MDSCCQPPFDHQQFEVQTIGVDPTLGRFADVRLERCRTCNQVWLCYHYAYEGFSHSGRWYRGLLNETQVSQVTAETAVALLQQLDWYFYGGSYFNSLGRKGYPPLQLF